jgi:hypothetical protein
MHFASPLNVEPAPGSNDNYCKTLRVSSERRGAAISVCLTTPAFPRYMLHINFIKQPKSLPI